MKFTLAQLKNAEPALIRLSKEPLPILVAFKLSRFLRSVGSELQEFEKARNTLVIKYGQEDSEKGTSEVTPENLDAFIKEIEPLLKTEIEIEFEKVKLNELSSDVKLTPSEAAQLEPFIDME